MNSLNFAILQADGLSESNYERTMTMTICNNCDYECSVKEAETMPKVSSLSRFMLHYFFNVDKNSNQFPFKNGFANQPDWFIVLWHKMNDFVTKYTKNKRELQNGK